eukprot:SAG22_NODE_3876_length_1486_cov_1.233598_2_plen_138_part_00
MCFPFTGFVLRATDGKVYVIAALKDVEEKLGPFFHRTFAMMLRLLKELVFKPEILRSMPEKRELLSSLQGEDAELKKKSIIIQGNGSDVEPLEVRNPGRFTKLSIDKSREHLGTNIRFWPSGHIWVELHEILLPTTP